MGRFRTGVPQRDFPFHARLYGLSCRPFRGLLPYGLQGRTAACFCYPHTVRRRSFCSHRGLTYGGVVTDEKMTAALMLGLFGEIFRYLRTYTSVVKWIYSPVPYIYARYPSEEDLYALYRFGARLSGRKVSTVIPSAAAWGFSTLRKRKVRCALREGLSIRQDDDFTSFWAVLEGNLMERHQSRPVHTLEEIMLLHRRFPQQILLYRVCRAAERQWPVACCT